MENNWALYGFTFLLAFSISIISTPYVKKLAIKLNAVDNPKDRGLHTKTMPRMGGLAIYLGFIISILGVAFVENIFTTQLLGLFFGATIIVVVGIFDDIHNLPARIKLAFQIIAALIVINTGTSIDNIFYPIYVDFYVLDDFITLIWIVGITNAVNIIDGVDGLAAGVSTINSIFLMILCILTGDTLSILFTSALAGSCLGFLPRNFNPAEIFMGDTGSTFLGFVLAVSSIMGVFKSYALLAILISAFAIALPIFDTTFAIIRRFLTKKPIMQADRGHLHHRLVDHGYSQKKTVIILYVISIFAGLISISIALNNFTALMLVFIFMFIILAMVYVYRKRI